MLAGKWLDWLSEWLKSSVLICILEEKALSFHPVPIHFKRKKDEKISAIPAITRGLRTQ